MLESSKHRFLLISATLPCVSDRTIFSSWYLIVPSPMNDRSVSRATVSFSQRIETNQLQENVGDVLQSKRLKPEATRNMNVVAKPDAKVEEVQRRRAPDPTGIEGLISELTRERRKSLHLAARVEALVEEKKAWDDGFEKLEDERSREWEAQSKPVARVEALKTANTTKGSASGIDAELARQREKSTAVAEKVRQIVVCPAARELCKHGGALMLLYIFL